MGWRYNRMVDMKNLDLIDNKRCFVCGRENTAGLRVPFRVDKETRSIVGEFVADSVYQGFEGITHGGILSTLLDEAMVKLAFELGQPAVTAWMEVRFISPLRIGEKVLVKGNIMKSTKRLIEAKAEISSIDGTLIARANGKLMVLSA